MAVLCEAISVVVRLDSIDAYFKGGWLSFKDKTPNATMCSDGELVRVGFLSPDQVEEFIGQLESGGLQFSPKSGWKNLFGSKRTINDIVVVDQHQGPTMPCPWIEFGKFDIDGHKISMCWLFEGERLVPGMHFKEGQLNLAAPDGWSPSNTASITFVDSSVIH